MVVVFRCISTLARGILTMLVDLSLPEGTELAYLRGPQRGWWEALIRRRLDRDSMSIAYAVGFGTDHNPDHAITFAVEALERDPQLISEALVQPTCALSNLDAALANLLTATPMTPSKPLFKLKS
jgi:hypothetical protein